MSPRDGFSAGLTPAGHRRRESPREAAEARRRPLSAAERHRRERRCWAGLTALALLALALCLARNAYPSREASAGPRDGSPASPGAMRVTEDDEWLLFRQYVCAEARLEITGEHTVTAEHGVTTVRVRWREGAHTFVDVDIRRTPCKPAPPATRR